MIFSKFTYDGIMGLLGKIKTLLTENVTTIVDKVVNKCIISILENEV